MMPDDPPEPGSCPIPANDNDGADGPEPEALRKVNAVALRLARIIGRRMAREDFEKAMHAANDNVPSKSRTDASDHHSGDDDDQ
ncbi:MAG: hypothetical protein GX970_05385 [Phyllobacteriaceae bacterium]|nr:hypothetical protein [Phyllobacteriaceae bacterium]